MIVKAAARTRQKREARGRRTGENERMTVESLKSSSARLRPMFAYHIVLLAMDDRHSERLNRRTVLLS